jgi:hypothetical protein
MFLQDVLLKEIFRDRDRDRGSGHMHPGNRSNSCFREKKMMADDAVVLFDSFAQRK